MADSFKKRRMVAADFISQDILREILKRLSVKSLLRFMCVEKSWYDLINSPYFIDLHFQYHQKNKNEYLLFQGRYRGDLFFRVDDEQCNEYYLPGIQFPTPKGMGDDFWNEIHGTCGGLICYSAIKKHTDWHVVYLWNPATRIYKTLPFCPDFYNDHQYRRGFAFGYFPKINDYKIMKFQSYRGKDPPAPTVCIYSLSTNSWKTVGKDKVAQFSNYRMLYNSVIVNGVAYWVGIKDPFMRVIVGFDIENEKIQEIMLPLQHALADSMDDISSFNLVQQFDQVLLSAVHMNPGSCILDIFSLGKGDGEDVVCTKKVTIDLNKVGQTLCPIGFRNSGEIVLFNYDNTERGFLSYDHEKKIATEILDDSLEFWSYAHLRLDEYFPGRDRRIVFSKDGEEHVLFFEAGEEEMQSMYVNSFAESLVLLGDKEYCQKSRNWKKNY